MTNLHNFAIVASFVALFASPALKAQQNTQTPQPSAAPQATADCSANSTNQLSKHIHFHLPNKLQQILAQQTARISQKTGIDLPPINPDDIWKQAQKPCKPLPSAPPPAPAPAPPTGVTQAQTPAAPASATPPAASSPKQ